MVDIIQTLTGQLPEPTITLVEGCGISDEEMERLRNGETALLITEHGIERAFLIMDEFGAIRGKDCRRFKTINSIHKERAMGLRRLRGRLDAMQGDAQATMGAARMTLAAAKALLEEIQDGVDIKLVRKGEGSILDFLAGKIDELPLRIEIAIEEDDDNAPPKL